MIRGVHVLLYSTDADRDRAFFRDVLKFDAVDAGGGWLIFALPPAEVGIHPAGPGSLHKHDGHRLLGTVMYLMCDDLQAAVGRLRRAKVRCTRITKAAWGSSTTIRLPSGGEIGLYQPTHPTALGRKRP
jgi:hypothetical protein